MKNKPQVTNVYKERNMIYLVVLKLQIPHVWVFYHCSTVCIENLYKVNQILLKVSNSTVKPPINAHGRLQLL